MINHLGSMSIIGTYSATASVPTYQGFTIPNVSVMIAKPVSYKFRVAEHVNDKDEVVKVGLQVAVYEHDNYGSGLLIQDWHDVERVKIKV
jgi:hypothetical protein